MLSQYPDVMVLPGNGQLFWGGGMRLAFAMAMQKRYEYYLWLNDDTLLEFDALKRLVHTHQDLAWNGYPLAIVAGSVKDPVTGHQTYGGRAKSHRWYSFKFQAVVPKVQPCLEDTMQGNIVLIPQSVVDKIGNIDAAFPHSLGDLDYELRAGQVGCSVWIAPGYLGTCPQITCVGKLGRYLFAVCRSIKKSDSNQRLPHKSLDDLS